MTTTRRKTTPTTPTYVLVGLDTSGLPRAWAAGEDLAAVRERVREEAALYIERKRETGEAVLLRLHRLLPGGRTVGMGETWLTRTGR